MTSSTIQNTVNGAASYDNQNNKATDNKLSANKVSAKDLMFPPDPIDVIEPIHIESTFENPFDFSSVNNPFSIEMPKIKNPFSMEMPKIDNSFSIEMPKLDIPSITTQQQTQSSDLEDSTIGKEVFTTDEPKTDIKSTYGEPLKKPLTPEEFEEKFKCSTCESRKYKDGSMDPGVSFKSATKVDKSAAFSAVAGHEQQHVSRNQDKAKKDGRKVVSQNVTYHSNICTDCNKPYIAGGKTTTVTKNDTSKPKLEFDPEKTFSFEI